MDNDPKNNDPKNNDPTANDGVTERVAHLLHEAAETHHRVYRIADGTDPDWASWYADWLIPLSELGGVIGATPVRSELVYLLVHLDKQYNREQPQTPWEDYYAPAIVKHFTDVR
jgi:hypothetical protein